MSMDVLKALYVRLAGTIGIRDGYGWSTGHIATLPQCNVQRRGEERRVEGAAGTADRKVVCEKNAANTYAWTEVTSGSAGGDVVGPSSSVASEIALFDGTTGKLIKRATGTGLVTATSGVYGTTTAPTFSDFTNANHDHGDADDGGTIPSTSVTGMAWTFINSAAPSAASTSSMDSLFSATYNHYLILYRLSMSASNAAFNFRFRASAADDANANYANNFQFGGSASIAFTDNTGQTSGLVLTAGGVGITWTDIGGFLHLYNPQDADETLWEGHMGARFNTPGARQAVPTGYFNNTTAFTGFSFIPASGNITGTWVVLGARDS